MQHNLLGLFFLRSHKFIQCVDQNLVIFIVETRCRINEVEGFGGERRCHKFFFGFSFANARAHNVYSFGRKLKLIYKHGLDEICLHNYVHAFIDKHADVVGIERTIKK